MLLLIIGLVIFFGIHLLPANTEMRDGLRSRLGTSAYMGVFSLISFAGLVLIVLGYHELQLLPGKNPVLWDPPEWSRHVAMGLMLFSAILLVAAYVPSQIRNKAKHPMLLAVKFWALAHLLANGDLASLVLFGSFLGYAVFDRISVKARSALGPLGDKQPGSKVNDFIVVGVGALLYFAFVKWGHPALIGVPVLPG